MSIELEAIKLPDLDGEVVLERTAERSGANEQLLAPPPTRPSAPVAPISAAPAPEVGLPEEQEVPEQLPGLER